MFLDPVNSIRTPIAIKDLLDKLSQHFLKASSHKGPIDPDITRSISSLSLQEKQILIDKIKAQNSHALLRNLPVFELPEDLHTRILHEYISKDISLFALLSTDTAKSVLAHLVLALIPSYPSLLSRYNSAISKEESMIWAKAMDGIFCEEKEIITQLFLQSDKLDIDPWVTTLLKRRPQLFSLEELIHITSHKNALKAIHNLIYPIWLTYPHKVDSCFLQKTQFLLKQLLPEHALNFLTQHPSIFLCTEHELVAKACIKYIQREIIPNTDYTPHPLSCYLFILSELVGRASIKQLYPLIETSSPLATELFETLLKDPEHIKVRLQEIVEEGTIEGQIQRIQEYLALSSYTTCRRYPGIAMAFDALPPHALQNILVDLCHSTDAKQACFSFDFWHHCIHTLLQKSPKVLESTFLILREKRKKAASKSPFPLFLDWLDFKFLPLGQPSPQQAQARELVAETLLQTNPELLIHFIDLFFPQTKKVVNHWISTWLDKCPVLLIKNIYRVFPDIFSAFDSDFDIVLPPIHIERLDNDKARVLWDTLCDIKDRITEDPPYFLNIMNTCIEWVERANPEDIHMLQLQPKHAKVSWILLQKIKQDLPEDKTTSIEKLIKDKEFKNHRDKKEYLWSLFSLECTPDTMNKILHYLMDYEDITASLFIKKVQEIITCLSLPESLATLDAMATFTPEAFIMPFIHKTFPQLAQTFWENYQATFAKWAVPYALIHYLIPMNELQDPEKQKFFAACERYITAVFSGQKTWKQLRSIPTAHTEMIRGLRRSDVLEKWHHELMLPMEKACDMGLGDETESYADLLFHVMKTMLIVDKHIIDLDTKMPTLSACLQSETQPHIKTPTDKEDSPYSHLEALCLELINPASTLRTDKLKCLQQIAYALQSPKLDEHQFAQDVAELISCSQGENLEQNEVKWTVHDTDAPEDLFLTPTTIGGSCQSVFAHPTYNRCLMSYVLDPKIRYLIIKDETKKPIARAVVKLMLRATANKQKPMDPVLFLERIYPPIHSAHITPAIVGMAQFKAKQLGIPLYISEDVTTTPPPNPAATLYSISSVDGLNEYSDAAAKTRTGDHPGITNGTYTILCP